MISIIIPTYNEAKNIYQLVTYLKKISSQSDAEIIVTDGGSIDNTIALARAAGAKALSSPEKGRSAQMNFGAYISKGDTLYFIHADTFPPESYAYDISKAKDEGYQAGRYRTKFNSNNSLLKINAFFTRFDWFMCYGGDQTLFVTRKLFNKVRGFNKEMQIMEDYDIVKRIKQYGKYKIFSKYALVSARKYDINSWYKVQVANSIIVKMYRKGASQEEMVNKYKELLVFR